MQLVRVSGYAGFEYGQAFSIDPNEKDLFVYDATKAFQVLGADDSNNSRQYSVSPYYDFVLTDTTPQPYFDEAYHDSRNLKNLIPNTDLPLVQMRRIKLHLANGWVFPSNVTAIWFRLYVKVNGIDITLASIIDKYHSSRIKPNNREIVIENVVFSQSIEVDIIDPEYLFNQTSEAYENIIDQFTNGQPITDLTNIQVEFGVVYNEDIKKFFKDNNEFERIVISEYASQIFQTSVLSDELKSNIVLDKNQNLVNVFFSHTRLTLEGYFLPFLKNEEEMDIEHQISMNFYDSNDNLVGTETIAVRNVLNPYEMIAFKPTNFYDSEHIHFSIKSIAINPFSGQEWIRTVDQVILTADLQSIGATFDVTKLEVKNEVTNVIQKVVAEDSIPNVIELIKPTYYEVLRNREPIVLTPYKTSVRFELDESLIASKLLTLRIGSSSYKSIERTSSNVLFTVDGKEYYKSDKEYYIVDESNQVVYMGKIERFVNS